MSEPKILHLEHIDKIETLNKKSREKDGKD